ncbi:hypothetical protein TrVE_jg8644 [Triparma verrucosa]|uniref:Glycosyl transferase CAP10 domain-containing protein n=1 Tax=Triparma verrucosa TaxID=1606542 RepID=A0A9W7B670_9STRA|nr:hypothetical protein TrVE_jg8644 [Triparma verrucosa]
MSIEDRVEYYTKVTHFDEQSQPPPPAPRKTPSSSESISSPYYSQNWNTGPLCVSPSTWSFSSTSYLTLLQSLRLTYFHELYSSSLDFPTPPSLCVRLGDTHSPSPHPCLTKSATTGSSIIYKLNTKRHWSLTHLDSTPWSSKKNVAIFRGATTGHPWPPTSNPPKPGCSRYSLISRYSSSSSPSLSVGVTSYVQSVEPSYGKKWPLPQSYLLKNKILIMTEGNDVATGLKWALLSNSAVLMERPKVRSWLMEDLLIPWKHYIPVADDFGDLEEKVDWCWENERECEDIGRAGKCWIMQFLDQEREVKIMRKVWEAAGERQKAAGTCDI